MTLALFSHKVERMAIDLLVFGPHPDDLELGLGGTIARHAAEGYSIGLCDLSAGELGSNGTPEERRREADAACRVLGAKWRENLAWPDGQIVNTPALARAAAGFIRRHQPRTIAIPYWQDRHPDHVGASEALTTAAFLSGLRKYEPGAEPWRPDWVLYYFINDGAQPSFVVNVSDHYEKKWQALACYKSQFAPEGPHAVPTRLTATSFRSLIESRDAQFGALSGVPFAEGFVVREPLQRASVFKSRP
jgi:bacillithiol biosynthesis deacetylase BshB1